MSGGSRVIKMLVASYRFRIREEPVKCKVHMGEIRGFKRAVSRNLRRTHPRVVVPRLRSPNTAVSQAGIPRDLRFFKYIFNELSYTVNPLTMVREGRREGERKCVTEARR
jgi:hypothetical protein